MDCPTCPEVSFGEVGVELIAQLGERRYPLSGTFEVTARCNLNCIMCYIKQPAGSQHGAVAREMTLPQVKHMLDQVAEAGCLFLLVTGGEPLLRPDFCDIWRHAKQKGIIVSLFTNGTMLTPRIADFLAEWQPFAVEITLYGATEETYQRVTQVPGSFARCRRGIELLLDRGLHLNLKSMLLRANRHELDAMRALAAEYKVAYRFDGVLFPRLEGDRAPLDQRLPAAEVVARDLQYPERDQELARLYREYGTVSVRSEYVYSCGAGRNAFHVDSAGQLSACMLARREAYDLLEGSFREGWEQFLPQVVSRKRELDTPCITCSAGIFCLQCPGWSQLAHGDDESPEEYLCEVGRLRAACAAVSAGAQAAGLRGLDRFRDAQGAPGSDQALAQDRAR